MRTIAAAIIAGMAAALSAGAATTPFLTYPTSNDAAPYIRELPPGVTVSSDPGKSPDGSPTLKIAFDVPECTFVPLVHVPSKWRWSGWLGLHYTAQICASGASGWGCLKMEWRYVGNTQTCSSTEPTGSRTEWGETKSFLGLPLSMDLKEIVFGVQVKGQGTLWVRNARVTGESVGAAGLPGWIMGIIDGVAGSLAGIWGGLIGYLGSKGRAKEFVLRGTVVSVAVGLLMLAGGVALFIAGMPNTCWYPCGLLGLILAVVFGANLKGLHRRYAAIELERMNAKDASDGI